MTALEKSNTKILVVDDNSSLRDVMSRTLSREGYLVTEANDGRQAQSFLEAGKNFHLIISDIRMPGLSGIDLLYYVKNSFGIPVILVTAFSELLEMRTAHEIGASGFLTKPFLAADLLSAIDSCLNPRRMESASEPLVNLDKDFLEINIEEFISGKATDTDLYFRLSQNKYVKVASAKATLDVAKVKSYIEKGVKQLFFRSA
jgi:two-component system, OmpR family, response regulator